MNENDQRYFMSRALTEIKIVESASSSCAMKIHQQLAEAYLAKLRLSDLERKEHR